MTDDEFIRGHERLQQIHASFVQLDGAQPTQELLKEYVVLTQALVAELRIRDPESAESLDKARAIGAGFDLEGVVGRIARGLR